MARKLTVEIVGNADSLQAAFGKAGNAASGFQSGINKASKVAAGGLAAVALGAKKLSDDASGLNESINATNVVFGDAGKKLQAFSKIAAQEAGLSMRSFNELVTPVGASLKNVGFSADQAATASISLAKRAADMASVFNVDVSEALSAIQSGLRGEADPLERFGVGLSDAAVKSQALTMGLAKTEKELTANDKAQARLALLMKQTDNVAGDFKKTSGELANAQRINAAQAENQRAKFGQGLLPVMETLQGVQKSLTTFLGEHTTATKVAVIAATGLAAAVLAVNAGVKVYQATLVAAKAAQALFNATMAMNPIGLVVIALVALGVGLVVAYKKSETFREIVNGVFNAVRNTVATVISAILGGIDKFLGGIQKMAEVASKLPFVGDKFKGIASAVGDARDKVQGLQSAIDGLKSKEITITTNLVTYGKTAAAPSLGVIGRRAHGGPVRGGSPYLVGERGPELMVPGRSGAVIPNGGARSMGGGTVINVTLPNYMGEKQEIVELLRTELIRVGRRNGGSALGGFA